MSPVSKPTIRRRLTEALLLTVSGTAAAALSACGEPPEQANETARLALDNARSVGVTEYAGESLQAAEAANDALSAELETQGRRPGLLRSFARAATLAAAARAAAEQATLDAEIGKERVHRRTQEIIQNTRATLEDSWTSHMELTNSAGRYDELAELESELIVSGRLLDEAMTMLAAGRYHEAEVIATAAQLAADTVETRLMAIRDRRGPR